MSTFELGPAWFERHADAWWDPGCTDFRSLRAVKAFQLELLRERFGAQLRTLTIVDLGAGGGLLAHPLAELGARVIAVELGRSSLAACVAHHGLGAQQPRAVCGDACSVPLSDASADLVLATDLLEHVAAPGRVIAEAARLVRPSGCVFLATINRTRRARFLAVTVAEGLGLVPRGTHDARWFVKPEEVRAAAQANGLEVERFVGATPRPCASLARKEIRLRRTTSLAVAYVAFLRRGANP